MKRLLEKIGITPLLRLPQSIRREVFSHKGLDLNSKFVLATLYYLDSRGMLHPLKKHLPRYTQLRWDECERCLHILAHLNFIEYREGRVCLRIKPISYKR